MGRKVDVGELVGTAEIAARLGRKDHRIVNDWIRRYDDFPEAVATIGGVRIWVWADVERWALRTGRA